MTALGRGLQSLIGGRTAVSKQPEDRTGRGSDAPREVPTGAIAMNPMQPREGVNHAALEELIASIRAHGILQPLVVSRSNDGYQLIAGERRLQAAKIIGLPNVPVIIRSATKQQQLELALVENLQRQELNPLDAAAAYRRLSAEFNLTQEEIAQRIGKSREAIANAMRLLHLPQDLQKLLREGKLSEGHAKILLSLDNPKDQRKLAEQILTKKLSVRKAESLRTGSHGSHRKGPVEPEVVDAENRLQDRLGTRVTINRRDGRGGIAIEFYSDEEFRALVERLTR